MTILALDVTSPYGSLALRHEGVTVAERRLDSADGFGQILFAAISDLLEASGHSLRNLDCLASATGPGAFTGVRVGLAAVKGMAEILQVPVCGVSNLRALSTFGTTDARAVILDARRGDVYAAVYDGNAELLTEETVAKLDAWLKTISGDTRELIVQDAGLVAGHNLSVVEAPRYLAAAIAACAEKDGKQGRWLDPAALDANYVRRSDAELFWREI